MYCSTSIGAHMLRGLGAAGLLALSFYVGARVPALPLLIIPMLIGAVLLLRGYPMCWVMGLFETVAQRKTKLALAQDKA